MKLYGKNLKYPPPEYANSFPNNFVKQIGNSLREELLKDIIVGESIGNEANPPKSLLAGKIEASISIPSDARTSTAHLLVLHRDYQTVTH